MRSTSAGLIDSASAVVSGVDVADVSVAVRMASTIARSRDDRADSRSRCPLPRRCLQPARAGCARNGPRPLRRCGPGRRQALTLSMEALAELMRALSLALAAPGLRRSAKSPRRSDPQRRSGRPDTRLATPDCAVLPVVLLVVAGPMPSSAATGSAANECCFMMKS
jgi:hypothetical protein